MPVQMVLGDIEHRGRRGLECAAVVELKAGQLQHPGLRQSLGIDASGQGVEQRRTDIAGHAHAQSAMLQQLTGQRGDRGLAVGAGDAQHLGRIAMGFAQALERKGKQIQFAARGQADAACGIEDRGNAGRAQARRTIDGTQALAIDQSSRECAGNKAHAGQFGLQRRQIGGGFARVGHRDLGTGTHAPACHGDARDAQTQNQHALALQVLGRALRPVHGDRWQLHHCFQLGFGLRLDLGHFGIGRIGDAGVGKNLCHEGGRIPGCRQGGDIGHRLGIQRLGDADRRLHFRSFLRLFLNHFRHIFI